MTDKPDWEKAMDSNYPDRLVTRDETVAFKSGYLAGQQNFRHRVAIQTLLNKYFEPTAVAATEKEGAK